MNTVPAPRSNVHPMFACLLAGLAQPMPVKPAPVEYFPEPHDIAEMILAAEAGDAATTLRIGKLLASQMRDHRDSLDFGDSLMSGCNRAGFTRC